MKNARIVHKGIDISELVASFTWTGSLNTVARSVEFEIVVSPTDKYLPRINIQNGDMIDLVNSEGRTIYRGHVFIKTKSSKGNTMSLLTYDYSIYLAKNKASYNFKNIRPKEVAERVGGLVGVKFGNLANPDIKISRIFENVSLYEIIQTAYILASRKSGSKYYMSYSKDRLNINEIGNKKSEFIISEDSHISDSSYSESIENMINRIVLYDHKGKRLGTVENKDQIKRFGVLQEVYKGQEKENVKLEGSKLLKGIERDASISSLGDLNCISGKSVKIKESYTGLVGEFFIISDRHRFEKNTHTMELSLSFNKIMDEKESGNIEEKKK